MWRPGAAYGALMGARGNSGVILSQIFRGLADALKDHTVLDGPLLAAALAAASERAYKAVMKPVEGTLLTVSWGAGGDGAVVPQDARRVRCAGGTGRCPHRGAGDTCPHTGDAAAPA